jgi:excisionase family DNA binding protein
LSIQFEVPEDLIEALTGRGLERLEERPRWAEIEGVARYLGCSVRRVRDLRGRGLPAKRVGKRLVFDLREVDAWLEAQ